MISCLVIAEVVVIKALSSYIDELKPLLTLQGSATSYEDGLNLIQLYRPGIVYIDFELFIECEDELRSFKNQCCFVALSNDILNEDKLQKFVFDYLVKPIEFRHFINSLKNYGAYLYQAVSKEHEKQSTTVECVKLKDKASNDHFVKYSDLTHMQGMENYVKYFSISGACFIKKLTMTAMLKELPANSFSRVHKSYVINDHLIDCIKGNYVYMNDYGDTKIPIGNAYKAPFFAKYNIVEERSNSKILGRELQLIKLFLWSFLFFDVFSEALDFAFGTALL